MKAIKESQRAKELQEEENDKIRENNLKQEVENKIRSKMKKIQREIEKEEKTNYGKID